MSGESSQADQAAVVIHIHNLEAPFRAASVSFHRSLADSILPAESGCAYTVAHTLPDRRVIRFERHLQRLFESARQLGYEPEVDASSIRRLLSEALERYGYQRSRFRITLPRDGGLIVAIEPYHGVPQALRTHGIECALVPHSARGNPATKTTSWIAARSGLTDQRVYEVLLCDEHDYVLEGSSSSVFFVSGEDQSPVLRTAGSGILKGVTRAIILEIVEPDFRVIPSAVHRTELDRMKEAFICSSTRGVVPIRRIGDIAYPAPGASTDRISRRYDDWVEAHAQPLLI
ncbi:MAG: aminotransferase class IV [Spirochaetales bacterium]